MIYYGKIPDVTADWYDFGIVLAMVPECAMILNMYTFNIFLNLGSKFFLSKMILSEIQFSPSCWGWVGGGGHENYVFIYITLIKIKLPFL